MKKLHSIASALRHRKTEKGQSLIAFGITIASLVSILVMAVGVGTAPATLSQTTLQQELDTATPTASPECVLISFTTPHLLQTISGGGKPRMEITVQNDNSQPVTLTNLTFDWGAYKTANPSQTGSKWTLSNIANTTGWSTSPFDWSGTGPSIDANTTSVLRFEFTNTDASWPANVSNTSFGVTATFDNLCTISVGPQTNHTPTVTKTSAPTLTPAITPTKTFTPTTTRTSTPATITLQSIGAQDGWVLESSENSEIGGSKNAISTTLVLGDDASNRQYRSILSFDTSSLPDNTVITSAVLKVKQNGAAVGTNPFNMMGNLLVDLRKGPFDLISLQTSDFQAAASIEKAGLFSKTPVSGWYSAIINAAGRSNVNTTGITQLRLYFGIGDNNNHLADYLTFDSGDASIAANRPVLEIKYYYSTPTPTKTITKTKTATSTSTVVLTPIPTQTVTATQPCFDC